MTIVEILLSGGRTTAGVVRVGDTVRRPTTRHAAFIHGLLNHLELRGFDGAPRFLGIDRAGRETLSFISGSVPPELGAFSEDQTAAAARLLRQLHDATLDSPLRNGREVLCHGDASPCNCVFLEGTPVAFIDFDNAHPGSRLDDLGYASWLWLDIGNDEVPAELQGRRIADVFRNYGLDTGLAIDSIVAARRPILNVSDMAQSLQNYVDVLGCTNADWGGPDFTHVSRDDAGIYSAKVARGCHLQRAGQHPWAYEMQVEDPDGHILRFRSEPNEDVPFEA